MSYPIKPEPLYPQHSRSPEADLRAQLDGQRAARLRLGTRGVVLDVPEMEDVEHFSWWLWLRRRTGDEVLEEVRAAIDRARGRRQGAVK